MEADKAREILGVGAEATRAEINAAWKEAMKCIHPDSSGSGSAGDTARAAVLNQAHDVALDAAAGSQVTLRDIRSDIERLRESDALRQGSEQAVKKVVMHHVGDLAFRKRQRAIAAGVSGVVAAVLGLFSVLAGSYEYRAILATAALLFAASGALAGVMAWIASTRERLLEIDIEAVGETLSDRGALASTLDELDLCTTFDRNDLHRAIGQWKPPEVERDHQAVVGLSGRRRRPLPLAYTATKIGPQDFASVLRAKGLELGLIVEETVETDGDGRWYGYRRV